MKSQLFRRMWFFLLSVLMFYGVLVLLVGIFQRGLIYFPARETEENLIRTASMKNLVAWRDDDGQLIGWRQRPTDPSPERTRRMLVFHGNAGQALNRTYFVKGPRGVSNRQVGWTVYLFEYPGYGSRPGRPSEKAINAAASEALELLFRESSDPVFVVGESLGSGVAARLAASYPDRISGVVLTTPFTSLADVAAVQYPYLPVRILLRDRYEVEGILNQFRGPVAFLLAGRDEIIPLRLGRRLHDGYGGPKRLWIQNDATHNTVDYSPEQTWWSEVTRFLSGTKSGDGGDGGDDGA